MGCMHCCLLSAGGKKEASIKDLSSLRERDTGPGKMRRDQEEVPTHTLTKEEGRRETLDRVREKVMVVAIFRYICSII